MKDQRIIWGLLGIVILLLMIAPIASYCLGRTQDYRQTTGAYAPHPVSQQPFGVGGPLIAPRP